MNTLPERIQTVKKVTGWTNAELARRAKSTRTAPTEWLSGKVKHISATLAANIEASSNISAMWLMTGIGEMFKTNDNQPQTRKIRANDVPIYRTETDILRRGYDMESGEWVIYPKPELPNPDIFAIIIKNDSMFAGGVSMRSFTPHDIVFFDPNRTPMTGDYILATKDEYENGALKMLLKQDNIEYLFTSNPTWQKPYIEVDDSVQIHGVAIAQISIF